jgi:hypothetical protein
MYTIMFVDYIHNPAYCVGYQLTRRTLTHAPNGRIRVARFTTGFLPNQGLGYYSDTHLRQFIRQWKSMIVKKKRRIEKYNTALYLSKTIIPDIIRHIGNFL